MATTITPEHDSGFCHTASENRRRILEQLRALTLQLENCENNVREGLGMQAESYTLPCRQPSENSDCCCCNELSDDQGTGHHYKYRYMKTDSLKSPLIVYPDYPPHEYRPRTPPNKLTFEVGRRNSKVIVGGTLVSNCECTRRNGLQDQCKKVECRGRPECLTKPEPSCVPGSRDRYKVPGKRRSDFQVSRIWPYPGRSSRSALEVCCKCPLNCWRQKQRKSRAKEKRYRIEHKQSDCIPSEQVSPCISSEQVSPCPYLMPEESQNNCYDQTFEGQFHKTLQTMEVDPLRGPLMSR